MLSLESGSLFPILHHTEIPVSDKQLAANRANAQKSTGPRTPEGKARSAQNARKHGFTASSFAVVRLEELDAVARLRADAIAVYQPANSQELFAVERIALAQNALLRCARLEAGLFTDAFDETMLGDQPFITMTREMIGDLEITRAQNRNFSVAEGMTRMAKKSNVWSLFLRYQAQTERLYRRAVEEFERLKRLRAELPAVGAEDDSPNEPIFETQLDRNDDVSASPETNPPPPESPAPAPPPDPPVDSPCAAVEPALAGDRDSPLSP